MKQVISKIIEIDENDNYIKKIYKLYGLKYKPKPIKLYIDSYGGLVHQAFGAVSVIKKSKTPVHTICTGVAMSCGFVLLVSGHKRFAYKNSSIMYHQISYGIIGKNEDVQDKAKYGKKTQKRWENFIFENTKIPKKKMNKINKLKKDWYLTAKKAKKYKIIDEIL